MIVRRPRLTDEEKRQRAAAEGPGSVWRTQDGTLLTVLRTFLDEYNTKRVEWKETGATPMWNIVAGHRSYTPVSACGVSLPLLSLDQSGEFEIVEDDAPDTLDAALKIVRDALKGELASRRRLQEAEAYRADARKLFPNNLQGDDLQAARELLFEANVEYQEAEELHLMALSEKRKVETVLGLSEAA
jgi:hypothetical protein